MQGDQPGAQDRSAVPGAPEDTETRSHQRASFNDRLAGGIDPTAPGAPNEPGGEAYTHEPNPDESHALHVDSRDKSTPGARTQAPRREHS